MILDERSMKNLHGVHPHLQELVYKAREISEVPFIVTEGLRTLEKQKKLLEMKATTTLKSRHLTGHAVDVAAKFGKEVRWDWPLYDQIAQAFDKASLELNIPVEWGGRWPKFKDGPHFQLPWREYP